MYIVALTGGIGSGKTEAASIFATFGIPIVDLDVISHELTAANAPLLQQIADTFGQEYIAEDAALNRTKMRTLIFNNDEAREKLNAILHPAIYEEAIKQVQTFQHARYVLLSIPLLTPHSTYLQVIDRILTVDCDEEIQIERVKQRSNLSETEIKKIIASQTPRQIRLKMSDDIIRNDGDIEDLRKKIENLHRKYIKTCIVNKTIS